MDNNSTDTNTKLYGQQLAENIQVALPNIKAIYGFGNIYLYLPKPIGEKGNLKGWLYMLLDTLPEIDHPLERIQFVVYENGAMNLVTVINPSEFDVQALDFAIKAGLNFSSDRRGDIHAAMPVDHPWYSDHEYFRRQTKRAKALTFDDIKDLANVKPLVDDLKSKGLLE